MHSTAVAAAADDDDGFVGLSMYRIAQYALQVKCLLLFFFLLFVYAHCLCLSIIL